MKTINFLGAPGAGKSATAMGVANFMKRSWLNCEYVSEFAKDQVWAESAHLLQHQNWVLANQELRLNVLAGKVDYALVDGSLLLSAFYAPAHYPPEFIKLCLFFYNSYDNINFFINRAHEYTPIGRVHSEEESDLIASQMKEFLTQHGVPFINIEPHETAPDTMFQKLKDLGIITPSKTQQSLVHSHLMMNEDASD